MFEALSAMKSALVQLHNVPNLIRFRSEE